MADQEQYKGLDVGGKKMDWVDMHHDRKYRPQRTAFHVASAFDMVESIKFLSEEAGTIFSKLPLASKAKQFSFFDVLAVDSSGSTSLHWAVYNANVKAVQALLKLENAKLLNAQDNNGVTPLHIAASSKDLQECLKALLEAGADMDMRDKLSQWTPLHVACAGTENESTVAILLEKSSKKQANAASSKLKQTPLHIASYFGHEKIVKLLLESGKCDISFRDACGVSLLFIQFLPLKMFITKKIHRTLHFTTPSNSPRRHV